MRFRKVISEPIEVDEDGVQVAGGINAVISANVNEPGSKTHVSSKQKVRVIQRNGKTIVEHETETDDDEA